MKLRDVPCGSTFEHERYTYLKTGAYQGSGARAYHCWNLEQTHIVHDEPRLKDLLLLGITEVHNVRKAMK